VLESTIALVSAAADEVVVDEIRLAALGVDEVTIRPGLSGVSTGTDKWVLQSKFTWGLPQYPLCPGYQRVGIIEDLGAGVTEFMVGQRHVATTSTGLVGIGLPPTDAWSDDLFQWVHPNDVSDGIILAATVQQTTSEPMVLVAAGARARRHLGSHPKILSRA